MSEKKQHSSPRRQERGKRRIAELMRAAGQVFAEVGYESATTNAIAARAGVSPGTLYQFFPNKQAIAEALANAYAAENQAVHEGVFDLNVAEAPLNALIDRLVSPFLKFRRNAPGFDALFVGSVVSRELAERIQAFQQQMLQRIAKVIQMRAPQLSAREIQTAAETSVQIVKGILPLAMNGSLEQRQSGERELKLVLERYLAPLERIEPTLPKTSRRTHRP